MKRILCATACVVMTACGGGGGGSESGVVVTPDNVDTLVASRTSTSGGPSSSEQDANFGRLLNDYRLASGVGAVQFDSRLNRAAQKHTEDMVKRGYFSHRSPEGTDVGQRVRAEGYDYSFVAENIAWRQQSDAEVFKDWQNSPSHDRAMKDGRAEDFGLGVAGTGNDVKWTLIVGAEK
ncbi:hypothetical protein AN189_13160 [Loktanella sp. 3ANDIMAR09]|uniref:CAP domain-containing protein n=1 Tax=Loktanella sp. 3ANDIMAR09 TaxID=1225657 RepID=UPI00070751D1|nr:CAP domain-containing protein [Loktanella sp. 3ANDIMAR09]KQI67747.1 hypothetical protein AN189_13160 [Loktanella sp. 3ANDIMAR09]